MKTFSFLKKPVQLALILMAFTAFCAAPRADAQAITTASFSQSSGTYNEIAGTTLGTGVDDNVYLNTPIGFTFKFDGTDYTTVRVSANGWIAFGTTAPSSYNPLSTAVNAIAALGADIQGQTTGTLSYLTSGSSPNQVFTVQWKDWTKYSRTTYPNDHYNFQIKLYESSNRIEIIYGPMTVTYTFDNIYYVGIRSTTAIRARYVNSGTNTWSTTTESTTNIANDMNASLYPASGQTYAWFYGLPNDGAIAAFTSPVAPFAPGTQNVRVNFANPGNNAITSATINWSINGVTQTPYAFSGTLAAGSSIELTLGTNNFVNGQLYTINATISNVNNTTDGGSSNNSLTVNLAAALSGNYTVGGTSPNFTTLAGAISALNNGGMTGPVTISLRSGTYNEQVNLNENIVGANTASNPIVIQSESGVASDVILQFAASSAANNYVIQLSGTDYVTIKNMTISATGTAGFATAIQLTSTTSNSLNGSDNVTIQGNILNGRDAATTAIADAVIAANLSDNHDNLTITGNTINNGSLGIYTRAAWTNLTTGLNINNNTIQNGYVGGIRADLMNGGTISGNTIIGKPTGLTTGYYIGLVQDDNGFTVERNTMRGLIGGDGIVMNSFYSSNATRARIVNNSMEVGANTANEADGIYILNRPNVDVVHNTIKVTSTNTLSDALEISSGTVLDVRNNILINSSTGRALTATNDFGTSNYNNFATSGAVLVNYLGSNYSTLAQWKAAGTKDANSISILPVFASATDLHIVQVDTRLFGLAGLTTNDIDNEPRRNYYIGADEVIPTITVNTQPAANFQGCFGSNTVLSVASTSTFGSTMSYQWQRNGSPIFDNDRFTGTTTPTLTILSTQIADAGVYAVRITDNSGATPVVSQTSNLVVFSAIEIVSQPRSAVICPGSEAALSVVANGTVNGIQWQKENPNSPTGYSNIPGATTPQIFLSNANYQTSGKYRAVLLGTCGGNPSGVDTTITQIATIFVASPTYVARQVENEVTTLGGTASLTVEAEVMGTPTQGATYQWYRNGVALNDDARIDGAKSSVLNISNIQSSDTSATYYAQVTGICGMAQSSTAKIYIAGITIATAPQATSVCTGATATMTVAATSSIAGSTMTYQWMRGNTILTNGNGISGANTSTLTISNATPADAGSDYRVKITSNPGNVSILSSTATLTVNSAPLPVEYFGDTTVCEGSELKLIVKPNGQTGLTYIWFKDGTQLTTTTDSVLIIPSASATDAGEYGLNLRNDCGLTVFSQKTVTIKAATTITTQPVAVS
ncbi:MAG: hypothetical protein V4642_14900, partial [Bacteroidota bacterium]